MVDHKKFYDARWWDGPSGAEPPPERKTFLAALCDRLFGEKKPVETEPSKGLPFMMGPPGTGKTAMLKALSDIYITGNPDTVSDDPDGPSLVIGADEVLNERLMDFFMRTAGKWKDRASGAPYAFPPDSLSPAAVADLMGPPEGYSALGPSLVDESRSIRHVPPIFWDDDFSELSALRRSPEEIRAEQEIARRHAALHKASQATASRLPLRRAHVPAGYQPLIPVLGDDQRKVERGFADLGAISGVMQTEDIRRFAVRTKLNTALVNACARVANTPDMLEGTLANIEAAEQWMWQDPPELKGKYHVAAYALMLNALGVEVPENVIANARAENADIAAKIDEAAPRLHEKLAADPDEWLDDLASVVEISRQALPAFVTRFKKVPLIPFKPIDPELQAIIDRKRVASSVRRAKKEGPKI